MISGQGNPRDVYDAQIVSEIRNIHAKPLNYDASKLLETLDEFELDPRVKMKLAKFILMIENSLLSWNTTQLMLLFTLLLIL